jgi:signal peptidase I
MDVDFSLILVVLTAVALVCWWAHRRWFDPLAEGDVAASGNVEERDESPLVAVLRIGRELFPVLALVLVLRSFLVEPFQIPSGSMIPTLEIGDFILVNKFAYGLRLPVAGTKILPLGEPERGDVMVFRPPNDKRHFIKRVIGLPGDRIEINDKVLTINGEVADQTLLDTLPERRPYYQLWQENLIGVEHSMRTEIYSGDRTTGGGMDPSNMAVTVKEGHYFMMGDNRDNSSDSRYWGQVPEANIVGKAFAIWVHWEKILSLPSFDRWGRIQ